jgi:UDP-GlcNAc:undecaprenyl-phosphate/decaprenyl-phosphate GlcNAc-1-phosphate transferase
MGAPGGDCIRARRRGVCLARGDSPVTTIAAAAFAIAVVVIAVARRLPIAQQLADQPNARSLHSIPTPRVGGLGVMLGALPVGFWLAGPDGRWLIGAAAVLAMVSLADDVSSLPVEVRLACHLCAAAIAVVVLAPAGSFASANAFALAVALAFAIAWMTNLFNFMDGADGLAGGMSVIGFGVLAIAAHRAGVTDLAQVLLAVSAASAGFLAFNFPPARVFLGDAGSVPLGFLAGALGLQGVTAGAWPGWFPVLAFSPFIVDATATLVRRLAAGERFWRAHRSHYYQRLVLGGWSKRRLAMRAWALMVLVGASALAALERPPMVQCVIIILWALAFGALMFWIDRSRPRAH